MTHFDFVGVDVAKDKFDVSVPYNGHYKHIIFPNSVTGHKEFQTWLKQHATMPWVCMEATGHYSSDIADFLVKQDIRVSVINPYQVKNFAKASLVRNKNDVVDAKTLSLFGQRMDPRPYRPTPPEQKELKELTKIFDMLKSQLTQLNNQLDSINGTTARKILIKFIDKVVQQIAKIEHKIDDLVINNQSLKEQFDLLTSIKGIGPLTAFRILALMPDINSFASAKQFAAYIGITPKQHQSGQFVGKTTISRIGDSRLRKSLYMAALVAKRFNEGLSCFVNRLQLKGKAPKTIICAVMRKLAHIIFGVLKNKQPFKSCFA